MGGVITCCSLLWDANEKSFPTSRAYTDEWALKLSNQFARHLTVPHRFVLFTDRQRALPDRIIQIIQPDLGRAGYGDCIRPFCLDEPMILVGMDTLIIGNIDKLANYCFESDRIALPKHPHRDESINGVVLCPAGMKSTIFDPHSDENDMEWLRQFPHDRIDDLWPGKVMSYKGHYRGKRHAKPPRIIYFHGSPKFEALTEDKLIKVHWH